METSFEVVKEEDLRGRSLGRGETLPIIVASLQPGPAAFAGNMRVNIGNREAG